MDSSIPGYLEKGWTEDTHDNHPQSNKAPGTLIHLKNHRSHTLQEQDKEEQEVFNREVNVGRGPGKSPALCNSDVARISPTYNSEEIIL